MTTSPPFGRLLSAMVTPFGKDGAVDLDEAQRLATHLVDDLAHDGLVINGTTGESPTTSDDEKAALLRAVVDAVGDRCHIVAGVGTNDTAHTVQLSTQAADAGANGLLVVTPYYSRPPQDAIRAHVRAVADATDLPIMLYDIPHRAGVEMTTATLVDLAAHPRVVAVKDAKGRPGESSEVIANSDLAYYAGDDAMTLPLLAVGGVGLVGTSTHFTGARAKHMIDLFLEGDLLAAIQQHQMLLPVYTGVFATQGCMLVKAGLNARGFDVGGVRAPLLAANAAERNAFIAVLDAAGL